MSYGFEAENGGGVYHSIYDDFSWYTRFRLPTFTFGRALARATGTTLMRLADADILPFDFVPLADTVSQYVKEVQKLARDKRDEAQEHNRQLDDGLFQAVADSRQTFVIPERDPDVPFVVFSTGKCVHGADFRRQRDESALARTRESGSRAPDAARLTEINRVLRTSESL